MTTLALQRNWRVAAWAVVACVFLLRLVGAAHIDLLPEEAYYWNYSRHLAMGYLDHPPMVAWLIAAGTAVFGSAEFGVRSGALACGAVVGFFVFRLSRNVFGEPCALLALAMSQALPFFFLAGMLMTPDAPLTAAWAAATYFLERALVGGRSRAWLGAGLAMGLGLLSKYTIGLLGVAALLFMVIDADARRWFRRPEPYLAVLLAAAVFAPVIVWNAEHEWASFAFQTSRRLAEAPRFSLHKLLGAALLLLTPTGLFAVAVALVKGVPENSRSVPGRRRPWRLLRVAVLTPLAVFALFSLRHEVKLDWTGAPWVAALPLMGFWCADIGRDPGAALRGLRPAWFVTLAALPVLYAAGFCYLIVGFPGAGYSSHTELIPVGWRDFGRQIDSLVAAERRRSGTLPLVVGMDRYFIASERAFYSDDQAQAVAGSTSWHLFDEMGLMYEQWFPAGRQRGRNLLVVAWEPGPMADARLAGYATSLGPLQEGWVRRNGMPVRRFYYRLLLGYH